MVKIIKQTASMHTSDGVRLDANIYRPNTNLSHISLWVIPTYPQTNAIL